MKKHALHMFGAVILAIVMVSGVVMLSGSTAQAGTHRGVVVVPRVYIGPGYHHHHWHHHRHYYRW